MWAAKEDNIYMRFVRGSTSTDSVRKVDIYYTQMRQQLITVTASVSP
jgi:hypothetical protein